MTIGNFWRSWRFPARRGPGGAQALALDGLRKLPDAEVEVRVREAMRTAGYALLEGFEEGFSGADWVLRRRGERTLLRLSHWRTRRVGARQVKGLLLSTSEQGAAGCKLVTCGSFADGARAAARGRPIELLDGATLLETFPQLVNPCEVHARDADLSSPFVPPAAPADDGAARAARQAPSCPRCHAPMTLRSAGAGTAAGVKYWACSGFPRCPGTRPT